MTNISRHRRFLAAVASILTLGGLAACGGGPSNTANGCSQDAILAEDARLEERLHQGQGEAGEHPDDVELDEQRSGRR